MLVHCFISFDCYEFQGDWIGRTHGENWLLARGNSGTDSGRGVPGKIEFPLAVDTEVKTGTAGETRLWGKHPAKKYLR
jgi:hypothetical protein